MTRSLNSTYEKSLKYHKTTKKFRVKRTKRSINNFNKCFDKYEFLV